MKLVVGIIERGVGGWKRCAEGKFRGVVGKESVKLMLSLELFVCCAF